MEKVSCNKCKTENLVQLKTCSSCGYKLTTPSAETNSFFTTHVKFQIVLAIVVFIVAFFGTKYLISEYKKSITGEIILDVSNSLDKSSYSVVSLKL